GAPDDPQVRGRGGMGALLRLEGPQRKVKLLLKRPLEKWPVLFYEFGDGDGEAVPLAPQKLFWGEEGLVGESQALENIPARALAAQFGDACWVAAGFDDGAPHGTAAQKHEFAAA